MSDPGLYQGDVPIANWTDPDRLVPSPVGQPDGKMLATASDALVYVDAPSGGGTDLSFLQPRPLSRYGATSWWGLPGLVPSSVANLAISAADRLAFAGFVVAYRPILISDVRVRVQTGAAGNARLGIYKLNDDAHPTDLVVDIGTVDTTSTGDKDIGSLAITLPPGLYASAIVCNATPTFTRWGVTSGFLMEAAGSQIQANGFNLGLHAANTYGPLPDPAPSLASAGTFGAAGTPQAVHFIAYRWTNA